MDVKAPPYHSCKSIRKRERGKEARRGRRPASVSETAADAGGDVRLRTPCMNTLEGVKKRKIYPQLSVLAELSTRPSVIT
ncbi:hypothetical protein CKAN_01952100 [Cinnamomum micranthum f. kanehirae]|uniref:Uncharacterized protein n=1 Tax=Cinnamomum micranthum f. kanehirae TaxID=337451 RepID=A0A3S3P0H9_9MAGN|nr:hypothetical protein CKAN_01952100 [Cinnamomum micranthum f. kanehirae]